MSTATVDLKKTTTSELVNLYNSLSGKSIKKFSSRIAGEKQVSKLIKTKKVPQPRKARIMNFRFAPVANEKFVLPREGTIRAEVFKIIDTSKGATLDEITAKLRAKAKNNLYECLRLISSQCGIGMWHSFDPSGEMRVRTVRSKREYLELLAESKNEH